jgi:5-formyltetrahydrofolate cyclo-ligase
MAGHGGRGTEEEVVRNGMTVPEQKRALREDQRRRFAATTPEERAVESQRLCRRLESLEVWGSARRILAFAARGDEPDLEPLLRAALSVGKIVALPRFRPATGNYEAAEVRDWERDLTRGEFDVREPSSAAEGVPLNQLDLVLVPGLAFDLLGARLGRGKGFYDRLLTGVSGHLCGVMFEWQWVGEVPLEPHDRLMNSILTPAHWRPAAR